MRALVAAVLVGIASLLVIAAVFTGVALSAAALTALVAGAVSCRIIYGEVTQTRRDAARQRAEQAQSFGAAMTKAHHEHRTFTASMGARLAAREHKIAKLEETLRLSEHRTAEAQSRAQQEASRADEAQQQLSALLDEVLSHPRLALVEVNTEEVPALVDLLAWEGRVTQTAEEGLRLTRREA